MNLKTAALAGMVLACGGSDSTGPTNSTLQNDDYSSGTPAWQSGFVTGEAAAARLGPQSAGYTIRHVRFLYGGAAATDSITLTIYQDAGNTDPGSPIHSAGYQLTASDNGFQDIDLTGANLHVSANQTIRVAITFKHDGLPNVAIDGARTAARNLVLASGLGWATSETLGINGDFIIRADISTP